MALQIIDRVGVDVLCSGTLEAIGKVLDCPREEARQIIAMNPLLRDLRGGGPRLEKGRALSILVAKAYEKGLSVEAVAESAGVAPAQVYAYAGMVHHLTGLIQICAERSRGNTAFSVKDVDDKISGRASVQPVEREAEIAEARSRRIAKLAKREEAKAMLAAAKAEASAKWARASKARAHRLAKAAATRAAQKSQAKAQRLANEKAARAEVAARRTERAKARDRMEAARVEAAARRAEQAKARGLEEECEVRRVANFATAHRISFHTACVELGLDPATLGNMKRRVLNASPRLTNNKKLFRVLQPRAAIQQDVETVRRRMVEGRMAFKRARKGVRTTETTLRNYLGDVLRPPKKPRGRPRATPKSKPSPTPKGARKSPKKKVKK